MPDLSLIDYLFNDTGPSDRERRQRMAQASALRSGWGEQPAQQMAPNIYTGKQTEMPSSDRTVMGDLQQLIPPNPTGGPTQAEQDRARRLDQEAAARANVMSNTPDFSPNQSTISSAPGFQMPGGTGGPGLQLGQQLVQPSTISPAIAQAAAAQSPVAQLPQPAAAPQRPVALRQAVAAAGGGGGGAAPGATSVAPGGPQMAPTGLSGEEQALRARETELNRQIEEAMKPPDRKAMEEAYGKRQHGGAQALMLSLAAQQAGQGFEPFQGHYLKEAAAAREPMKMAGGTMTPEGFVEDPGYAQDMKIRRTQALLAQTEHKLDQNLTRQDRKETEARHEALTREMAAYSRGTALATAAASRADKAPTQVGTDPSGAPVFAQGGQTYTYQGGKLAPYTGNLGPKSGEAKGTEGERAAAGYLGRMQAVEGDINKLAAGGGQPSLLTKTLGSTKLGRIARPYVESTKQQDYRAVQEDWVRAKLRKESGASIPTDEMEREIETYFPQPGETDAAIIQRKAQARAQALEQMRSSAGAIQPHIAAPVSGQATASGGGRVVNFADLP